MASVRDFHLPTAKVSFLDSVYLAELALRKKKNGLIGQKRYNERGLWTRQLWGEGEACTGVAQALGGRQGGSPIGCLKS